MLTQWYDVANMQDRSLHNDKKLPGLRESFREVVALIENERKTAGIPASKVILGGMPVFLSHGTKDEKLRLACGEAAGCTMTRLGFDVEWKTYEGLGHCYTRRKTLLVSLQITARLWGPGQAQALHSLAQALSMLCTGAKHALHRR